MLQQARRAIARGVMFVDQQCASGDCCERRLRNGVQGNPKPEGAAAAGRAFDGNFAAE